MDDDIRWERAHPEIPTLVIDQTLQGPTDTIDDLSRATILPGSPASYDFSNHGRTMEIRENLSYTHDRHIVKLGAALPAPDCFRGTDNGTGWQIYL